MGFTTTFKNFGHAIATAAKYTVKGIGEVVLFANKAKAVEPGVELLIAALAGPQAAKISDLAFHALGDVATAIEKVGGPLDAATTANGLNVAMDLETIQAVKDILPVLKAIIASVGGAVPTTK